MSEVWRLDNGMYLDREKAGAGQDPHKRGGCCPNKAVGPRSSGHGLKVHENSIP